MRVRWIVPTMISRSVSRFTLNGMFLMTIAVGITSSSRLGVPGALICGPRTCGMVGEPPEEERSELLFGDRERLSLMPVVLSSHCF